MDIKQAKLHFADPLGFAEIRGEYGHRYPEYYSTGSALSGVGRHGATLRNSVSGSEIAHLER